ncbi:MAG: carbohydrate kinase [Opitutaceae bacterium]|nr:carbohydrate kinase [Opitutaceae bacterium]MBP9912218.1 carbohydrate kinase [Opitutaceae bacterium]
MPAPRPTLLCFGEILWDFLPAGRFPGGAPFNVAYHLHRHGTHARVASAVGRDALGDELLQRLTHWGLSPAGIARHGDLPTGRVNATISDHGDATYEIVREVAWDRIEATPSILQEARSADGLIYGSLAQRSAFNQATLDRLLTALPAKAWRIFDINLRPPHDDAALVQRLARHATLLKLNAAEAARLVSGAPESPGREETDARAFAATTGCSTVCITSGARGAGLLRAGKWHWEPGRAVNVVDTVGAGDAFLAALVSHLLPGSLADAACLARACRIGEWVASQRGATPEYTTAPV